jgi:hypothetical protein
VLFFFIKNILKNKKLKKSWIFLQSYTQESWVAATSDLRVIFIILKIKLNLHDPVTPDPRILDVGLAIRSCNKSVIIK